MKKVIFLFLFFILINVKGLEKEFVDTEYIEVYYNGVINNVLISSKAVYMEHQGVPLYCLDFSIPISRTNGYDVFNFNEIDKYSSDQKLYIERISYFGYKYWNHNDIYYYLATQELIWGSLGIDAYWTNTRYGGDIIDLSYYKMDILNLYAEYLNENYNYNDYYTMEIGNSYKIQDLSNILPQYEYEYIGFNDIGFSPREITIYARNKGVETLKLIRNYSKGFESKIFIEPNYQTIIKPGNIENKYRTLNFVINNTNIYLNRINESTNINNNLRFDKAIYDIYDINNNYIKTVLTNDSKEVIFPDMPLGEYKIIEVSPSYGFKPSEEITFVNLSWENTPAYVDLYLTPILKELTIVNIYKENGIEYYDQGIMFEIYKNDILIDTISTNNEGFANKYLEYGTYLVKQINSRNLFDVEPTFSIEVNDLETKLNYVFYKEYNEEVIIEDETIDNTPHIEEIPIIENIEPTVESTIDNSNENNIIDETLNIEYEDTNNIVIDELPQLFDDSNIFEEICEKLFVLLFSFY